MGRSGRASPAWWQSSAVVGMFFGALVLGHLTDRIGRKAMYVVDLICFVVFAALTALSQNVWEFIAFRFLLGVGIGADYPDLLDAAGGIRAPSAGAARLSQRSVPAGFWARYCAYLAGYLLLPLGPDAWRWMLFLGAAIALVVICFRAAIPESPRWLAAQGRHDEAGKLLLALSGETGTTTADRPSLGRRCLNRRCCA